MNKITFNQTANIFLNAGIIALTHYLEEYQDESNYAFDFNLAENELTIESEHLFQLLEDVYYLMGKEVYDTATQKQRQELGNAYYDEKTGEFKRFPKMNTYGLTQLLTNNVHSARFKKGKNKLKQENPDLYLGFEKFFHQESSLEKTWKDAKTLYFNEPYKMITLLDEIKPAYFQPGKEICYLTGESYKKLINKIGTTSPFFSGLTNFNSFLKTTDKKISWKAMYLSRFAPKFCLYKYANKKRDTITCYFLESNNLENLKELYQKHRSLFKDSNELLADEYVCNFKLHNFKAHTKKKTDTANDFTEPSETLFMLIYTIYRQFLFEKGLENITDVEDDFDLGYVQTPISLVSFKADSFSQTIRPNSFEHFNDFKFAISLIRYLEKNGLNFQQLLASLKFLTRADKNSKNKYRLERQIRNKILDKVLKRKSIIKNMESLFYDCFKYLMSGDDIRYKNFKVLLDLVILYEPVIKYAGNQHMTKDIQEKAIKLGSSIGMSILRGDNDEMPSLDVKKSNAKTGRSYIIGLHKARTFEQFREAIIRLQTKYNLIVSGDLLNKMNEENYEYIKQFAIISALNQINFVLKPIAKSNEK
jgi:hypothetical protein